MDGDLDTDDERRLDADLDGLVAASADAVEVDVSPAGNPHLFTGRPADHLRTVQVLGSIERRRIQDNRTRTLDRHVCRQGANPMTFQTRSLRTCSIYAFLKAGTGTDRIVLGRSGNLARRRCKTEHQSLQLVPHLMCLLLSCSTLISCGCSKESHLAFPPLQKADENYVASVQAQGVSLTVTACADTEEITLALQNHGESVIVVDGRLVFLVRVDFYGLDGRLIQLDRKPHKNPPCKLQIMEHGRLVELGPGAKVVRTIHVKQGWEEFVSATVVMMEGWESASGWVNEYQLPADHGISSTSKIVVTYENSMSFRAAIHSYLNQDPLALQVYEGPLSVTVPPP